MPQQPLSLRPDYGESDAALPRGEDSARSSASRVAERFRRDVLAREFPTEEARKKYLEEHPGADSSKHTVAKPKGKKEKKEDDAPKVKSKGEHSLVSSTGGRVAILSGATKHHITHGHTKPGKGSVFNPDVDLDDIQKAIADLPDSFYEKGGGAHEVKVPNAGYDLVQKTSNILDKYPNAKKVTVEKEERGKVIKVTGYVVDNDIKEFASDVMTVVLRPTTSESKKFLPKDLQDDEDVDKAVGDGKAFSVLSSWPGKSDVPMASQWGDDYAVIIPNGGEGADTKWKSKEAARRVAARYTARFSQEGFARSLRKEATMNALDGMPKRKAKDVVNRLMDPHTKGLFRDQYWLPINAIWKALETQDIPFAITRSEYEYEGGRSNGPVRKVWTFEIDFRNERGHADTLYGRITAAGAGSVAEPLEKYDVTAYVV